MSNCFGTKLQLNLAGAFRSSCRSHDSISVPRFGGLIKRRGTVTVGYRTPRRILLGLGVSFWSQFMSMAGNSGVKTILASARQKGEVENVNFYPKTRALYIVNLFFFVTCVLN